MRDSLILSDRRRLSDRRMLDEGPPPGVQERRMRVERRGLNVEELELDEYYDYAGFWHSAKLADT